MIVLHKFHHKITITVSNVTNLPDCIDYSTTFSKPQIINYISLFNICSLCVYSLIHIINDHNFSNICCNLHWEHIPMLIMIIIVDAYIIKMFENMNIQNYHEQASFVNNPSLNPSKLYFSLSINYYLMDSMNLDNMSNHSPFSFFSDSSSLHCSESESCLFSI